MDKLQRFVNGLPRETMLKCIDEWSSFGTGKYSPEYGALAAVATHYSGYYRERPSASSTLWGRIAQAFLIRHYQEGRTK